MEPTLKQRVAGLEQLVKPLHVRIGTLEDKVRNLETWAGPGQAQGLSDSIIEFRAETNRKLDRLTRDVTRLQTDVAGLKTDMAEVKGTLALILDRLPAKAV